jgi:hypothetical protein
MEKYIGVKEVEATPMTRIEYNNYRVWEIPVEEKGMEHDEGHLVEYLNSPNSNHPNHEGYISWSPKKVFEESYFSSEIHPSSKPKNPSPHQERVLEEYRELLEKSTALSAFIFNSEIFPTLDSGEQDRLKKQRLCMYAYLSILKERIENF